MAEYRTLVQLTAEIELAVKDQLVDIGSKLVASELITPAQARSLRNTSNSVESRAADLVEYIQTKVQQNSQHYSTFIGVLEKDLAQYDDILKKLREKYDSLRGVGSGDGGGQATPAVSPSMVPPTGGMLPSVLDSVV